MNPFGAVFTITLLILIVAWPFIAIYIAKQYTTPSTRQGFTACSNKCSCSKIYAPHSGEAP